jgi:hypothetical protein
MATTLDPAASAKVIRVTLVWSDATQLATPGEPLVGRAVGALHTIVFDSSPNETHGRSNEITEHPLEVGANVADHVRPKQPTLSIEAIFSNSPALADTPATPGSAESLHGQLEELSDAGQVMTVTTSLKTYDSMVIESISTPRSSASGDSVRFTIGFRKLKFVSNRTTKVIVSDEPKAQPQVSKGSTVAPKVTQPDERRSVLSSINKAFGDVAGVE